MVRVIGGRDGDHLSDIGRGHAAGVSVGVAGGRHQDDPLAMGIAAHILKNS